MFSKVGKRKMIATTEQILFNKAQTFKEKF